MRILDRLFLRIGSTFTTSAYMVSTTVQGLLWSAADITLALVFLKIADEARRRSGKGKIRVRYGLVWASALLTLLLPFARTPRGFFHLESVIFGLQYLVLLFSAFTESRMILDAIRETRKG